MNYACLNHKCRWVTVTALGRLWNSGAHRQLRVIHRSEVSQPHNHPGQTGDERVGSREESSTSADVRNSQHLQTLDLQQITALLVSYGNIEIYFILPDTGTPMPRCLQKTTSNTLTSFSSRITEVIHLLDMCKNLGFKRPHSSGSQQTPIAQGLLMHKNSHYYFRFQGFYWRNSANFPLFACHVSHCKAGARLAEFQTFTFNIFFPFIYTLTFPYRIYVCRRT